MRKHWWPLRFRLTHIAKDVFTFPPSKGKGVFHRLNLCHVIPQFPWGAILHKKSCLVLHAGMPISLRPSGLPGNPGEWGSLWLSFLGFNFAPPRRSKPWCVSVAFILYSGDRWTHQRLCLISSWIQTFRAHGKTTQRVHSACPLTTFSRTEISMMVYWPDNKVWF